MKRIIPALFILLIPLTAPADDATHDAPYDGADEGPLAVDEIVITATRTFEETLFVPEHVSVITSEDIRMSGAVNTADILDREAGISVTDYGPEGALQSLSVRGSTSEQVLVLVDGVRINNAQNGGVDLSLIPIDSIERIEVVRGGTSALYGADAVGGVVNIITRKEADGHLTVALENGSYIPKKFVRGFGGDKTVNTADYSDLVDTQKATVRYSTEAGRNHVTGSGSFVRARNGYIFKDTNNEDRKRENAGLLGGDLAAGLFRQGPGGDLHVKLSGVYSEKGVPGDSTTPLLVTEQTDTAFRSSARFTTDRFFSDLLTFDGTAHVSYSNLKYYSPEYGTDSDHSITSVGADLSQELLSFVSFSLLYGVNLSFETLQSTDVDSKNRMYGGVFVESPLYLSDTLTLYPAVRYDYYSDFAGDLNYKLGTVYSLSSSTSLKASISKSYRAPTFNDLYWPQDSFSQGNPDLRPETGYGVEAGISRREKRLQLDLFGFARYVKDVILWQPGDDSIWRPTNWGEGLYPGVEANFSVRPLTWLSLDADYTFIYSFVLSGGFGLGDNRRLPMIPVHEADLGVGLHGERESLGITSHYESLRYLKTSNTAYLPSHYVVDVSYRRNLRERLVLTLAVDNLFNEHYEITAGYPIPGTLIRAGVEATF